MIAVIIPIGMNQDAMPPKAATIKEMCIVQRRPSLSIVNTGIKSAGNSKKPAKELVMKTL